MLHACRVRGSLRLQFGRSDTSPTPAAAAAAARAASRVTNAVIFMCLTKHLVPNYLPIPNSTTGESHYLFSVGFLIYVV